MAAELAAWDRLSSLSFFSLPEGLKKRDDRLESLSHATKDSPSPSGPFQTFNMCVSESFVARATDWQQSKVTCR